MLSTPFLIYETSKIWCGKNKYLHVKANYLRDRTTIQAKTAKVVKQEGLELKIEA
jgi:hypothetical protein